MLAWPFYILERLKILYACLTKQNLISSLERIYNTCAILRRVNRQASVARILIAGRFGIFSPSINKIYLTHILPNTKKVFTNPNIYVDPQNYTYNTYSTTTFTQFTKPKSNTNHSTPNLKTTFSLDSRLHQSNQRRGSPILQIRSYFRTTTQINFRSHNENGFVHKEPPSRILQSNFFFLFQSLTPGFCLKSFCKVN